MNYHPALTTEAEKLLSSKLPSNIRSGVFYSDAHNRHTLESAELYCKHNPFRDHNGNFLHISMGDKSRYYDNPDVITMGCSFTEAGALPSMLNWSKFIEQKSQLKVNNCGYPGSGVAFQAGYASDVISRFGAPKTIYLLLPNIDRAWLPEKIDEQDNQLSLRHVDWDMHIGAYVAHTYARSGERIFNEFTLNGTDGEKYRIPPELVVFYSFLIIDIFESLCKAGGITFKFATWHTKEQNIFNNFVKYDSYEPIKLMPEVNKSTSPLLRNWRAAEAEQAAKGMALRAGPRPWEVFGMRDIHVCDHEPQTEMQEHYWVYAADGRHAGVHDHIHFAEHFMQQQITNEDLAGFLQ